MSKKTKFNRTVAKEIAEISFGYVLDCIMGYSDSEYSLCTDKAEFTDNFIEDLEERNLLVTERRVEIIGGYYDKFIETLSNQIERKYYKKRSKE